MSESFNIVDLTFILIIIFGGVQGFISGMIVSLVSIISIIITIFFYTSFSSFISNLLIPFVDNPKMLPYLTAALMLLSMTFISMITGKIAQKALHATSFGVVDKILGAIFGGFKWFFIGMALFWMISISNQKMRENYFEKSFLCTSMKPILTYLMKKIEDSNEKIQKANQIKHQRIEKKKRYKYSKL